MILYFILFEEMLFLLPCRLGLFWLFNHSMDDA